jgi:hypothetical protein
LGSIAIDAVELNSHPKKKDKRDKQTKKRRKPKAHYIFVSLPFRASH